MNTIGSYECTCAPGFKRPKNKHKCATIGLTDALLLYAGSKSVNSVLLKSKRLKQVAHNLNQVVGIAYDGEHVYWTDISIQVERIMRGKPDGTEIQVGKINRINWNCTTVLGISQKDRLLLLSLLQTIKKTHLAPFCLKVQKFLWRWNNFNLFFYWSALWSENNVLEIEIVCKQ